MNKNLRCSQFHAVSKSFTGISEMISNRQKRLWSNWKWADIRRSEPFVIMKLHAHIDETRRPCLRVTTLRMKKWTEWTGQQTLDSEGFNNFRPRSSSWMTVFFGPHMSSKERQLSSPDNYNFYSQVVNSNQWNFLTCCRYFVVIWTCVAEDGKRITWR